MEYFCLFKFSTVSPKKQNDNADATLIPAPDRITPIAIIGKLSPKTTSNEPKLATPKDTAMVGLRPKLSAVNEEMMNPSKDPKYGELLMTSKRN